MPAHKQLFMESKERCKAHTALVNSDAFEIAVTHALADYAADCPTQERLIGVHQFLDRFTHLAEIESDRTNTIAAPKLVPWEKLGPETK